MVSIAVLDDYQNVALKLADWSRLQAGHRVQVFNKHFGDPETAVKALQGFEVVGVMRERTPFPRALFDSCPISSCWWPPASAAPRSILPLLRTAACWCAIRAAPAVPPPNSPSA